MSRWGYGNIRDPEIGIVTISFIPVRLGRFISESADFANMLTSKAENLGGLQLLIGVCDLWDCKANNF